MQNRMKARLLAGRPARGVSVMIPSPQVVEMLGRLGFDWVLIDCEHGTISRESVEEMVRAAEASGITPIARPTGHQAEAILHVLECGALGVQVPHVHTAVDARRVVEAVKYHPLGSRSLAAATRPAGYGLGVPMAGYVEAANRETLVCVQLEDEEGLRHLDEMLEVEGVDVVFIGPSDLAQSMGYPGRADAPEVQRAMAQAFARIAASGRIAGSTCRTDTLRDRLRQRVLYVYTHLPALLAAGATEFLGTRA
ncbi:MAG TPA: aldolase/citrate lyase family protein [bacterium]|nr:aldolase/citrate lyase family protein [bacterium]